MDKTKKLIKEMRALLSTLNNTQIAAIDSISEGMDYEKLIANMIDSYPEIWGKGGIMRPWLERYSDVEFGMGDKLPSDVGFDNPNE